MANSDNPSGFRLVRRLGSAPLNGGGSVYYVDGAAANLFPGDPVTVDGTANSLGVATVDRSTAGISNPVTGIMMGAVAGPDDPVLRDDTKYIATGASGYILVEDDPNALFECQIDGAVAITDIQDNCEIVLGTGNTLYGTSAAEADYSTIGASTSGSQLRIMRVVQRENNEVGANAKIEVLINNHSYRIGRAGV